MNRYIRLTSSYGGFYREEETRTGVCSPALHELFGDIPSNIMLQVTTREPAEPCGWTRVELVGFQRLQFKADGNLFVATFTLQNYIDDNIGANTFWIKYHKI